MIKPGEIDRIAHQKKVRAKQIEKDYVISWILWGISGHPFLNSNLVFKGGTCLKQLYFEDYRFSEDLDFTLQNDFVQDQKIVEEFENAFRDVFETSRIRVAIMPETVSNHEGSGSLKFKLAYHATHGSDEIKVDITRGEIIEFQPEKRALIAPYSDLLEDNPLVICYSLNEILIEKLCALMGRTIPRDLYDFFYLVEDEGILLKDIYIEFSRKAAHKGHVPANFWEKVNPKMQTFERDWKISLAGQMSQEKLPDFKELWRKSSGHFKFLTTLLEG
ncbi:MAG: nucleotidyl transferase AbiEii/AbiGii toxin family protein [Bacteroidia bacterium]|nr:nucleotidyl transferase AbiEii/AbiGii toxin family protein [Bacteroidia bacterium]